MTKRERGLRLELAYELIAGVHSDLCRGNKTERTTAQDPNWMGLLAILIRLSKKVEVETEWKDNHGESQCSACGFSCGDDYYLGQGLFCPECGAKMKKPLREGTR